MNDMEDIDQQNEKGNGNAIPDKDSGFSRDYCEKQLNYFATERKIVKAQDPYQITYGVGMTLDYLNRVISNWETQYRYAIEREANSNGMALRRL